MNMTTLIIVNALLALAVIGGLAAVARTALRLRHAERAETLHPSQPIPLRLAVEDEQRELASAA
jgi:hypothetical protein